jgi:hypothetical protein
MKTTKRTQNTAPVAGQTYGEADIARMAEQDETLLLQFEGLRPRALFRTADGRQHPIGDAFVDQDGYPAVYFGSGHAADTFVHRVGRS